MKKKFIMTMMILVMLLGSLPNTKTMYAAEIDRTVLAPVQEDLVKRLGEDIFKTPLKTGMIIEQKTLDENGVVSRLEFMSMLNNALGFFEEQTYKGLEDPSEPWYSYVINTAKAAGYAYDFDLFIKNPEVPITKYEAAQMIARIRKTIIYDVETQGILKERDDSQLIRKEMLEIFNKLKTDTSGAANVARVDVVGSKTLLITLDSFMEKIDLEDIGVYVAKGDWSTRNPDIFTELAVEKVSTGINKLGNTVLIYELSVPLQAGATVKGDESEAYKAYFKDFQEILTGELSKDRVIAENIVSWQMEHGGWTKNVQENYVRKWDGAEPRSSTISDQGVELGTTDNNATIREIVFLADMYNKTKDQMFKDSALKGIEFLLKMQYPSGGWAQMYPSRTENQNSSIYYSNFVTFNDNAMGRVLECFDMMINKEAPFNTDIINEATVNRLQVAYDKGIDYILKSQIKIDGKLTVWCAQHDPVTYEPRHGRPYEHESLSGAESVSIVALLMSTPKQTPEVRQAVLGALEWFEEVKLEGIRYDRREVPYFVPDASRTIWYRFYEIGTNKPIFSDRDGIIKHEIMEIGEERRHNYAWAGSWAQSLLNTAKTTGYYKDKVYVKVINTNSTNKAGFSLEKDALTVVNDKINQ